MNHPTAQPTTRGDFYRLMSTIANHRPELYSLASEAERRYVAYPALLAALKGMVNNTGTGAIEWAIEQAKQAIALAEGSQP